MCSESVDGVDRHRSRAPVASARPLPARPASLCRREQGSVSPRAWRCDMHTCTAHADKGHKHFLRSTPGFDLAKQRAPVRRPRAHRVDEEGECRPLRRPHVIQTTPIVSIRCAHGALRASGGAFRSVGERRGLGEVGAGAGLQVGCGQGNVAAHHGVSTAAPHQRSAEASKSSPPRCKSGGLAWS